MTEDTINFLEGINEENVTQEIWKDLNELHARVAYLVNYKYHLILYRLARGGTLTKIEEKDGVQHKKIVKIAPLSMDVLTHATGYTRQRIHQITTQFERREIERLHNKNENS